MSRFGAVVVAIGIRRSVHEGGVSCELDRSLLDRFGGPDDRLEQDSDDGGFGCSRPLEIVKNGF